MLRVMRMLITGASGHLGSYVLRELQGSAHDVVAWAGSRSDELYGFRLRPIDFTAPAELVPALVGLRSFQPDVVIHLAATSNVAACAKEGDAAHIINCTATERVLEHMPPRSRLVYASTDLVFDGKKGNYVEADSPAPLSVYGQTKQLAETACLRPVRTAEQMPQVLVIRLSLLFGPTLNGSPSFFDAQLQALRGRTPLPLFEDEWRTPLSLKTAARALLEAAFSRHTGLLHLGGHERMSRLEMGRRLAAHLGCDPSIFVRVRRDDVPAAEPRPRDTSLNSAHWRSLFPTVPWPGFEEALEEMKVR